MTSHSIWQIRAKDSATAGWIIVPIGLALFAFIHPERWDVRMV